MTQEERETTVNYSDADTLATVMSYNASMAARLKRLLAERPDEVTLVWESEGGVEVRVPKKWIKVQPPPTISDERREAMRETMQKLRRASEENAQN